RIPAGSPKASQKCEAFLLLLDFNSTIRIDTMYWMLKILYDNCKTAPIAFLPLRIYNKLPTTFP
ncbi:hypothetical protein, partial [Sphingobacterium sp. IITKGP-BTPF85]|uniref:hypothetical protein n=1 Tax=Sphingobacterium sp. IITKGP-BTPF85 TaxID=1338009 RepID=UPI0005659374